MNKKISGFGIFLVAALTLLDQGTKLLAVRFLKNTGGLTLIDGVLELKYLENRGMAFGLLQGKIPLFVLLCLVFGAIYLYVYRRIPKTAYYRPLLTASFVLAAGGLGNLIDRVFRGYVVDFIYFSLIDFPIFNVADILVVCSLLVLALLLCLKYKEEDFSDFLS